MKKQFLFFLLFFTFLSEAQNDVYFDGTWILESLIINGEVLTPPSNEEIDQVFLGFEFNNNIEPDGIIIEFCRWAYNFIDLPGDATTGYITIGEVNPSDNICNLEENLSFDELYFEFYNSDDDGTFEFELDLESNNSTLVFRSSNGDEVLYRDTTLSIDENAIISVKLYPIPSKKEVFIDFNGWKELIDLRVYNLNGRQVTAHKTQNGLNIEKLSPGIYIVELIDQNGWTIIKQFIKS